MAAVAMLALAGGIVAVPVEVAAADTKASASSTRGDVRALQRKVGVTADGIFGPATERALKRWQRRHGLVADGIAGPQTRSAMGLGAGPVLKRKRSSARGRAGRAHHRSHRGGGVRSLQRRIGVPADGVFGPATEAALKRWQAAHGLVADGVAGPQTREKLGLGPGPVLKRRGGGSGGGGGGRVSRLIRAANRIAERAVQVRRRARDLPRQRLRLLGVGLLRAALRGPAADPARLERADELRPSGPRPPRDDLRERGPRLHDGRRPPLRHERDPRDRLALDQHGALVLRLRRAPPAGPLGRRVALGGHSEPRPAELDDVVAEHLAPWIVRVEVQPLAAVGDLAAGSSPNRPEQRRLDAPAGARASSREEGRPRHGALTTAAVPAAVAFARERVDGPIAPAEEHRAELRAA